MKLLVFEPDPTRPSRPPHRPLVRGMLELARLAAERPASSEKIAQVQRWLAQLPEPHSGMTALTISAT